MITRYRDVDAGIGLGRRLPVIKILSLSLSLSLSPDSAGDHGRSSVSGSIQTGRCPHSEVHGPQRRGDHHSTHSTTGQNCTLSLPRLTCDCTLSTISFSLLPFSSLPISRLKTQEIQQPCLSMPVSCVIFCRELTSD